MSDAQPGLTSLTSTIAGLQTIPLQIGETLSFQFDAPRPGLYQFSVIMDARDFDWEQLYEILNKYHNVNRRTGPWDFSINFGATPLVPSYWVSVNGRRIGLWFFERVSLEDLERRRFRGKFAFFAEGPTTIELTPFRPEEYVQPSLEDRQHAANRHVLEHPQDRPAYDASGLRWISAVLEVDPEDTLEPLPEGIRDGWSSPAAQWRSAEFWSNLRERLQDTHAVYARPLQRSFEWVLGRERHEANDLLLLVAAWRLTDSAQALQLALETVDRVVEAPYWGNPNPAGYSHNGDMAAMGCLRGLAWAYHMLHDELGEERRAAVLEKLRRQGTTFFDLALLNRDYWGGSVVQDHGWKSIFGFGVAALHLLGILPEATRWCEWVRPRLRRSLAAMPLDGVIPLSSHNSPHLYLDEVAQYRDALLIATGEDVYDAPQFRPIVTFMATVLDEPGQHLLAGGRVFFAGGSQFLNRMASKHGDRVTAWLQATLLQNTESTFYHATLMYASYLAAVYGLLSHDPEVAPEPPPARRMLAYFPDSGFVHYRPLESRLALSIYCGPGSGYNSYRASLCPCDRLDGVPAAGHFNLFRDAATVLGSPDAGYSLHTHLRSCLLVNNHGQVGDIGYPMSIPSKPDTGAQVQFVRWDGATQTGFVRLFLTPAYPAEARVAHYTRDFLLRPASITVRDTVTLDEPAELAWLFQGHPDETMSVEGLTAQLGGGAVRLAPVLTGDLQLRASIQQTDIVYSYASSNNFRPFEHVRYESVQPVQSVVVEFVLEER